MSSPSMLNYLNVVAFVVNIGFVQYFGMGMADGSQSNAALSLKYETIITPAGWAFSIWGIIYLFQLAFTIVQLFPTYNDHPLVVVEGGVGYDFVGACIAQAIWSIAFSYEYVNLSFVLIVTILYFLHNIVKKQSKISPAVVVSNVVEYWFLKFPFAIHCGWIVAATVVSLNLLLTYNKIGTTIQLVVALISLVGVTYLAVSLLQRRDAYTIALVEAWATFAICIELGNPKDIIENSFDQHEISLVRWTAGIATVIILGAVVLKMVRHSSSATPDDETHPIETPTETTGINP